MKELPVAGTAIRETITAINQLIRGRSNAVGQFTMAVSGTATVVPAPNISPTSQVFLSPLSATAQTATFYISTQPELKQFTVHHASAVTTDRTFGFLVLG